MIVGTLIMWVGWLFLHGGLSLYATRDLGIPKVFHNTFLGGAAGGITALIVRPAFLRAHKHVQWYDVQSICNGILAGLVSISASVDRIEPWAAVCISIIGATFYSAFCKYLECKRIDDPVEGTAVHMICGMWGVVASGFFDNKYGLLYNDPAKGRFFGYQVCGTVVIFAWASIIAIPYFLVMQQIELFRIDRTLEVIG
jgi:Amt family ammonium transporter